MKIEEGCGKNTWEKNKCDATLFHPTKKKLSSNENCIFMKLKIYGSALAIRSKIALMQNGPGKCKLIKQPPIKKLNLMVEAN